ncbi:hypothetical protein [Spirosoma litoris]
MEKQKEVKAIRAEDLTPEQREKWLAFYRKAMQRKRETQAEMREYAKTPEHQEVMRQLREENAKRGTPYL